MNVLIGLDQWANTILGGAPDETISSRSGRARDKGKRWGRLMCWWLDKIDPGHCKDAIQSEREERQQHPDLRVWWLVVGLSMTAYLARWLQ